jgi:hypothetical protein
MQVGSRIRDTPSSALACKKKKAKARIFVYWKNDPMLSLCLLLRIADRRESTLSFANREHPRSQEVDAPLQKMTTVLLISRPTMRFQTSGGRLVNSSGVSDDVLLSG